MTRFHNKNGLQLTDKELEFVRIEKSTNEYTDTELAYRHNITLVELNNILQDSWDLSVYHTKDYYEQLTYEDIQIIRRMVTRGVTSGAITKRFNISNGTLQGIINEQ